MLAAFAGERRIRLRHGTTLRRATSIAKNGPNPNFVEPEGNGIAEGFSTAPASGPFPMGRPEKYANGKARIFRDEGGPAVLEIDIPESIARLGLDAGGEIRFDWGFGLQELLDAWPLLTKRVIVP